jgi:hypothetical protein
MASDIARYERPPADDLHPVIYKALAGLVLWLVIAAWVFFGGQDYAGLDLAVVTGFFLIAAAIPYVMWRVWRSTSAPETRQNKASFSDWWHGELDTWQGRVEGWDASVEVLLPLGIAAVGMTAIGLVFRLSGGGW